LPYATARPNLLEIILKFRLLVSVPPGVVTATLPLS
jgi:hypothetical protein